MTGQRHPADAARRGQKDRRHDRRSDRRQHRHQHRHPARPPLVAGRRCLPDLPPLVQRLERRRHRRSPRHHRPARPPAGTGCRHRVAQPALRQPQRRQRLRRARLPRRDGRVRHHGRLRRDARRYAGPRHPPGDRPGCEPLERRTRVVRAEPIEPRQPVPRLLRLARRARRRAAEQLPVALQRVGLGARRTDRPVVPALLRGEAARPELGEPDGPHRGVRPDAVLARQGRRRVPDGRDPVHLQAARPARSGGRRARQPAVRLRQRAAGARVPARDARAGAGPLRRCVGGRGVRCAARRHAVVRRLAPRRAEHAVPVRHRAHGPRSLAAPALDGAADEGAVHPHRCVERYARLEHQLPRQPRQPAAGVAVRRRQPRAPRGVGQGARHPHPHSARHAVPVPG